jgi:hypothetical protein
MASSELPKYQSHKQVWALKIAALSPHHDISGERVGDVCITPADQGYASFVVSADYVHRHDPQVGGYYVVYEDGYQSFSPAEAFESGYTALK